MLPCYTGVPIQNKVLDGDGKLLPEYWTLRTLWDDGTMTGAYHLSVVEAVEDAIEDNTGILGIVKVEWCGEHIGKVWNDVTERFKSLYHERTTNAE